MGRDPHQPPEHEIIEQIEEEELGRPLDEVCEMLQRLGRHAPTQVLLKMARAGQITFCRTDGTALPTWEQEAVFRGDAPAEGLRVLATEEGSRQIHDG